jgi:hypothetical protein
MNFVAAHHAIWGRGLPSPLGGRGCFPQVRETCGDGGGRFCAPVGALVASGVFPTVREIREACAGCFLPDAELFAGPSGRQSPPECVRGTGRAYLLTGLGCLASARLHPVGRSLPATAYRETPTPSSLGGESGVWARKGPRTR